MTDQQQVFTIDTGMGNCDTAGMPTLADASLAETAARLQQVQPVLINAHDSIIVRI